MLRHPLCVGHARRVVLQLLARRYGREFAEQWEFVRFARARNLELDFTARPRRPEAQAPQVRKRVLGGLRRLVKRGTAAHRRPRAGGKAPPISFLPGTD